MHDSQVTGLPYQKSLGFPPTFADGSASLDYIYYVIQAKANVKVKRAGFKKIIRTTMDLWEGKLSRMQIGNYRTLAQGVCYAIQPRCWGLPLRPSGGNRAIGRFVDGVMEAIKPLPDIKKGGNATMKGLTPWLPPVLGSACLIGKGDPLTAVPPGHSFRLLGPLPLQDLPCFAYLLNEAGVSD